jgi:hypothetical protein
VDRLAFVALGDSRPADVNDDGGYPAAVLGSLFEKASATPAQFVLSTGDYMNSNTEASVGNQLSQLLAAERAFSGPIFHAMGNHECSGPASSNCPNGTESPNVRAFQLQLVPFAQRPYYSLTVDTSMGAAKIVVIAANAWDETQRAWLEMVLGQPTAYTFVIRHEPPETTDAPGVSPSDAVTGRHPLTLAIFGHKHEYQRLSANQVISGNGGAPLACGTYGFLYVVQRPDGNIQVEEHRQDNGSIIDAWIVTPTGVAVP